jgi:hypothetical protein
MANTKTTSSSKRATSAKTPAKKTQKVAASTEPEVSLGKAVQMYVKSSSHPIALSEPTMVRLGGLAFIEGTQVTGKVGHRLEGKKTLVACDNIASLIEFASEDDIWSEPQSKLLRNTRPEEEASPVLTMHEQGQSVPPRHGLHFNGDRQRFDRQPRDGQGRGDHRHRGNNRHHGRN